MSDSEKIFKKIVGSQVKQEKPAVSIIIPNYNTAEFISGNARFGFRADFYRLRDRRHQRCRARHGRTRKSSRIIQRKNNFYRQI